VGTFLIAFLLSLLLFGLTLVPGYLYGNEPFNDTSNCDKIAELYKGDPVKPPCGQLGETEPPWWSNGLPLSIYSFGDCPSGCIADLSVLALSINLLFWFTLSYIFFSKVIGIFKK